MGEKGGAGAVVEAEECRKDGLHSWNGRRKAWMGIGGGAGWGGGGRGDQKQRVPECGEGAGCQSVLPRHNKEGQAKGLN